MKKLNNKEIALISQIVGIGTEMYQGELKVLIGAVVNDPVRVAGNDFREGYNQALTDFTTRIKSIGTP